MPNRIAHIRPGEVVEAQKLNEVIDRVNQLKNVIGKNGVKVENSSKGIVISLPGHAYQPTDEPALAAKAMNVNDGADIPAFGVAAIRGQVDDSADNYEWERILEVDVPSAEFLYPMSIATRKLLQEFNDGEDDWLLGGRVWVSGVCPVTLKRWFCDDNSDIFLRRAIPYAGQTSAVANIDGPLEILWEEDFIGVSEHLAVVRFITPVHTPLRFRNLTVSGGTTTYFGCPMIANRADTDGLTSLADERILTLQVPPSDAPHMVYVCMSDTVTQFNNGWCIYPMGPFLARVDQSVTIKDPVGAEAGETTFMKDSFGFRVLAYLGTYDEKYWAVLVRDTYIPLLKATSDPSGDAQNVQTVDEDDSASGHDITVNVPGS